MFQLIRLYLLLQLPNSLAVPLISDETMRPESLEPGDLGHLVDTQS
jgi:hypothetical protein